MLDLLRFAAALLPLAAYTNVLGLLRLRSRPTVLSGAADLLLLGLGVMGFIAIGPVELFFPRAAYAVLGVWVWLVLLILYCFVLLLVALNTSPKLVIYGVDAVRLRQQVSEMLEKSDVQSQWLGDILELPEFELRACIEPAGRSGVSQIVSTGNQQNIAGWIALEKMLAQHLRHTPIENRNQGVVWIAISVVLFAIAAFFISSDLPRLQQAMSQMFDNG